MSVRLRLTLLYSAVLAVTLALFGAVSYFRLDSNLRGQVDRSLSDRATRDVVPVLTRPPGPDAGQGAAGQGGQAGAPPRTRDPLFSLVPRIGDPDVLVQLDDGSGQPITSSQNLNNQRLPLPQHLNGNGFATITVNHTPLRVLVRPVSSDLSRFLPGTRPPYTLLLARSLSDTEGALGRLRVILLLGGGVGVAVAAAAGWLLARGALRPIDRLTATAQRIGRQQDFGRRVDYQGPDDEVGRLATTFNEMLESLSAAHQRVQKALDAQRRFVADASHELRTPLTTIRGNVDLLQLSGEGDADQQEALADIASEAERMSRLVNNLLALARADSGQHIPLRPVEAGPVVQEVYQKARRLADGVALRLDGCAEATVMGDHDFLVQLLFILVDNAFKYTPPGGTVTLSSRLRPEVGELRIAVADTGAGIAPEDQARIFDRFYRADPSRHGEGTGLGLSIAAWIAQELGGRIELRSAPGKGSTFTVVLAAAGAAADGGKTGGAGTAGTDDRVPIAAAGA
jgi:two-component system, OmpR family, sensor kinase